MHSTVHRFSGNYFRRRRGRPSIASNRSMIKAPLEDRLSIDITVQLQLQSTFLSGDNNADRWQDCKIQDTSVSRFRYFIIDGQRTSLAVAQLWRRPTQQMLVMSIGEQLMTSSSSTANRITVAGMLRVFSRRSRWAFTFKPTRPIHDWLTYFDLVPWRLE